MSLNAGPGSDIVVSTQRRADVESLFLTGRTYAQLKSTPGNATGDIAFCSDCEQGNGLLVVWNGNDWFREVAEGGDMKIGDDGFIYHAFTDPGNFEVNQSTTVDYIIISGGGAGSPRVFTPQGGISGSGGGGGDMKTAQNVPLNVGSYAVVSGNGGQASASDRKGQTSSFNGQTCEGGGGGGAANDVLGQDGACGGGSPGPQSPGQGRRRAGVGNPGFPGGGWVPAPASEPSLGSGRFNTSGSGGGGLESAGDDGGSNTPSFQGASRGGDGGQGRSIPSTWDNTQNPNTSSYFPLAHASSNQQFLANFSAKVCAGGGGGGCDSTSPSNNPTQVKGGLGGSPLSPSYLQNFEIAAGGRGGGTLNPNPAGGNGPQRAATPAQTHGSGGGGGGSNISPTQGAQRLGGNGGDGIVIIRYPNPGKILNL